MDNEKIVKDNTLILVDYDNVFITLKNNYRDFRNPNIMYDVITKVKEHYKEDNILSYKLFADFQKVQISDEGYEILKKNHVEIEHVFNGKNASDVILMINCMKYMLQYPHINKIVLISSDSDIVPIFHEVQLLNKKLEVLYFDVNTGVEHKEHIKQIGIPNITIENLLGIEVYPTIKSSDDLYTYKNKDKKYFNEFLQKLNDTIREISRGYDKKDSSGNVICAGGVSLRDISEKANEVGLWALRECTRNENNVLVMLQEKNILIEHSYQYNKKSQKTYILSEQYLQDNGITITNLLKISNYSSEISI